MTPTPWILKSTSGTFATSASVSALTASQNDILNASTYVSSHSGALSISANGVALLQNWDGSTPSAINITGTGGGFSPTVAVTPIQAVGTTPSGVTVTFTYGDEGSQTTSYSLYDGVSGVSGSQGKTGRSLWVSDLTAVAPTTEHTCGGSAYTIHYEDETYEPQAYTITAWNGNSGTNGVNGTSPTVSTENITDSENRTGTKITFNYGDNLSQTTSYSAWNGKDGDAGSLPSAPANPGDYLLQKTAEGTSWKPYTEPTAGTQVSGENGISARKAGDVTYVGLDAETIDITGAGSVSVTSNAQGQLVISGKEVSVPENVMVSGNDMSTGTWVWDAGKFVPGMSYYANYKTYKTEFTEEILTPISSVYATMHNNSVNEHYNFIQTDAYNNNGTLTTGQLFTLPNHWTNMIKVAGTGLTITAKNDYSSSDKRAYWILSANIPNNIATSAGIVTNSAYYLTSAGWSAFNPAGSKFTGVVRDDSLSGTGVDNNSKLGVNAPYLSNYFLPLSGGTVTPLNVDGVNASLNVSGDSYDIFKVVRGNTTAIFGATNTEFAFIKTENKGNQLELSDDHLTYKTNNMASTYLIPVYSADALDSGKLYAMNGDGSTWTEVHNTSFVSGQTVSYNNDTFNYIPAKIEQDATASGSWNNDGILHFILE